MIALRLITGLAAGAIYVPGWPSYPNGFPEGEGRSAGGLYRALVAAYAGGYLVPGACCFLRVASRDFMDLAPGDFGRLSGLASGPGCACGGKSRQGENRQGLAGPGQALPQERRRRRNPGGSCRRI